MIWKSLHSISLNKEDKSRLIKDQKDVVAANLVKSVVDTAKYDTKCRRREENDETVHYMINI